MSLPNNVQIVLMQGKTVVLETVILIAASNFHVLLTVIGAVRIIKENFLLTKKLFYCMGLACCVAAEGACQMRTSAIIMFVGLACMLLSSML